MEFLETGFAGECSREEIARLQILSRENGCSCTIGLGGGKVIDISVIAAAPTRFLVSGMGDALSTYFEARANVRSKTKVNAGLPVCLEDIGVQSISEDKLREVAEKSCIPEESIYAMPFEITVEGVMEAILKADRMGRTYKAAH